MRPTRSLALLVLGLVIIPCAAVQPSAARFPLKDGDIWVMAGDSITAQKLHSNYFEAFCYARYPKMKFAFRNSGVGGHTIPTTLARFDYDIAAWKPTVVSVELGMNDAGNNQIGPTDRFMANMGTMVGRIRAVNARPVILAASPVNDGTTLAKLTGRNQRLGEYATALKEYCAKEQIPYGDQFHALVDIWGKNKPRESLANTVTGLKQVASDDTVTGVEHLRAFLAAQEKSPIKAVSMLGDPVHPGAPGQLMMAAALLKGLGADGFVSSATIDATGRVTEAKGCTVTDAKAGNGGVAFDRLDECLPFPIADNARVVLPLAPDVLELSQYTLKVTGLSGSAYTLKINGIACARLTGRELAAGVNLTNLPVDPQASEISPIIGQSRAILAAVAAKESIVGQGNTAGTWRNLSQRANAADAAATLKDELVAATKKVEDAEAKIREAAKPQKMHFELIPVTAP